MGRVLTLPCEVTGASFRGYNVLEGNVDGSVDPARETTTKRSPGASMKCDSGAGNAVVIAQIGPDPAHNTTESGVYVRFYFCFSHLPTATTAILRFLDGSTVSASAKITSGGKLQFWDESGTPAQIGSDSAATISADSTTWYRVEMFVNPITSTPGGNAGELKLDGVSVASTTTGTFHQSTAWTGGLRINVGWVTAPGANKILFYDDGAVNDTGGGSENGWPGDGKVVLLVPTSDNARGANWLNGASGTTNLYDAVNNIPPTAVAIGSAGATTQIRSLVDNATEDYDANMTTYTAAGVGASDTIKLVQGIIDVGCDSTTSPSFAVKIVSNPTQGSEDTAASWADPISTWQGGSGNWRTRFGTAQYAPSVTLGTAPVLRIGRRTASATVTMTASFMGIAVEYTAGSGGTASNLTLLGVG